MKIYEKYKEQIQNSKYPVIAAKVNNEFKNLAYELNDNDNVELIDLSTKEGTKIFRASLVFITIMAASRVFPEKKLYVNYQLHNAMYCEMEKYELSIEDIQKIENEAKRIVKEDYLINEVVMDRQTAKEFFDETKTTKGLLQYELLDNEKIVMYFCEEYFNYNYFIVAHRTGLLTPFRLIKYNNGFLLNYPSHDNPFEIPKNIRTKKLAWAMEEYKDIHKILNIGTVFRLNNAIKTNKIKDIIMLDEALHEKKIANIADKIARLKDIRMVLIARPTSSGKTTFAQRLGLQLRLNKLKPVTISVDNYFVEREQTPLDENGKKDFECIEAIDLELFNHDLTELLKGNEIIAPTFDFKTGHKEFNKKMQLHDDEILVIEGIHCLNEKLTQKIDSKNKYKIYISCLTSLSMDRSNRISSTDTRLIRRIVRDANFRGYSAKDTIKAWPMVNKGEEKNIFPYQEMADSIFNSALIYELCVLKPFAIKLLEEIKHEDEEYGVACNLINILKYIDEIPQELIPTHSLLKEFIGGGSFEI